MTMPYRAVEPDFAQGGAVNPQVYAEYLATLVRNETPRLSQSNVDFAVALAIQNSGLVANLSTMSAAIAAISSTVLPTKADLVGGLIPTAQIPPLALTTSVPVASQAAMLALTSAQVQPGDLALRSDGAGTFMLMGTNPGLLANWNLLPIPTYVAPVQNALTRTGTVNVTTDASGLASITHTLGVSPSFVGVSVTGNTTQPLAVKVSLKSSTSVQFLAWNTTTGAALASTAVVFDYYLVP